MLKLQKHILLFYVENINGSFFLFNIYFKLLFFVPVVSVFFNFIYIIFNFIFSKMRNDPFIKKWFWSNLYFENSIYKFKVSQSSGSEISRLQKTKHLYIRISFLIKFQTWGLQWVFLWISQNFSGQLFYIAPLSKRKFWDSVTKSSRTRFQC